MKVFISGSKCVNEKESEDWKLPESVRTCLDNIMSEGNEILIGDCRGIDTLVQKYLNENNYAWVTVYESGNKRNARNNLGHWDEKHFSVKEVIPYVHSLYVHRMEKDFHMADDCDYGVAIWNGESKGTFINMLCLCALGKTCKLYLLQEDWWVDVNSLEDLRGYTGSEGIITEAFTSVEKNSILGRKFKKIKHDIRTLIEEKSSKCFNK